MSSIDIVIPCYRYGRYLRDCVNSVLSQNVSGLRILIIDDASPDDTPEIATELAQQHDCLTYWRHAANQGHIATFNEGIAWCNADYMLLLSADDYLLPGALKRAIDLMSAHPEVGLCIGEALELQEGGHTRPIRVDTGTDKADSVILSGLEFIELVGRSGSTNIVPTPTAIVATRLLKLLGGYRPELTHTGDLEMWLRLAAHSAVGVIKKEQAVYRRHATNMSTAYYQDYGLKDLQQRKAAFDTFLRRCKDVHPQVSCLYQTLLPPLAREAIDHASSAFNSNRLELSQQLSDFALSVDPSLRQSLPWQRLAAKRALGFRLSTSLRSFIANIRSATTRMWGHSAHESPQKTQ